MISNFQLEILSIRDFILHPVVYVGLISGLEYSQGGVLIKKIKVLLKFIKKWQYKTIIIYNQR